MPHFAVRGGQQTKAAITNDMKGGVVLSSSHFAPDDRLILWYTRGDFRRYLSRELGRDLSDDELDEVTRLYGKSVLTEVTELINEIVNDHQEGGDNHDPDEPDFLKRKGD